MAESNTMEFKYSLNPRNKARYARESLEMAKLTRAHLFMDFFVQDRVLFQAKGACQKVDEKGLVVYLREKLEYLPAKGMRVHVYFSLRHNRKPLPCDFSTTVLDTEREAQDDFLILSMPRELSHHQRRFNVRIAAKKEEIGNFRIWFGKAAERDADGAGAAGETDSAGQSGHSKKTQWIAIGQEHVKIIDISAGGMQLSLSRKSLVYPLLSPHSVFLISGDFFVKNKEVTPLVLAGNVVRLQQEENEPEALIGLSYRQWAKVGQGGVQWISMTTEDGVSPVASWVFQAIMDRYKLNKVGGQLLDL